MGNRESRFTYDYDKGWLRKSDFEKAVRIVPVEIIVTPREHGVTEQAIQALTNDPILYQYSGELVHIVDVVSPRQMPKVVPVPFALLRDRLSLFVNFVKWNARANNYLPVHPPEWCVRSILARGDWPGIRLVKETVYVECHPSDDRCCLYDVEFDRNTGELFLYGEPLRY